MVKPFLTTTYPITGDSRENIICIGKYKGNKIKNLKNLIKNGKRETYLDMFYKFEYFNYRAKNIKHLIAKIEIDSTKKKITLIVFLLN